MSETLSLSWGIMSPLSLLQSSSAPAYYDIVPVFSQSIAFNRTGAHSPNWKELWPPFHQSHSRAECRAHRALRGMKEMCGVSLSVAFSLTISPSCTLPLFFLSLFFSLCDAIWWLWKHFTGNEYLVSHQPISPFPCRSSCWYQGRKKINTSLKEKCLHFSFLCLMCLKHEIKLCPLLSSRLLSSFVEERTWKKPSF